MAVNSGQRLTIYYQNVRGLRTKTDSFYRQVSLNSYDVIVLTETWLIDGLLNSELFDDRYIVWRRDRDYSVTGQSRGGGVLIATRRELSVTPQPLLHSSAEDLWITLRLKNLNSRDYVNLYICAVYLCKQNKGFSFSNQLANFLTKLNHTILNNTSDVFLVLGDFNMSGISWVSSNNNSLVPVNPASSDECMLTDELSTLDLGQYNGVVNKYGKLLDLVLSNKLLCVSECVDPLVTIDPYHPALLTNIDIFELPPLDHAPRLRYIYSKGDFNAINKDIDAVDWECQFSSRSLDDSVAYFIETVRDFQNRHIPQKLVRNNSFPIWYSASLIRAIKEKYKYLRKFKTYGNRSDELTFKYLRDRVKSMETSCYNAYLNETEKSIKSNPKHFWKFVHNRYKTNAIPNTLNYNNELLLSGDRICEAFSSYFLSTFLDSVSTNCSNLVSVSSSDTVTPTSDIYNIEINIDTVIALLRKLDPSKGAGPDNISSKFLIKCASSIALPISILFSKSLSQGVVPRVWKSAFITPVHKKGSKTEVTNYRPISKLCIIAKIFERIIYNQLYPALSNSFSTFQHGFLRGRSTTSNLILFNDYITEAMDKGKQVDVVYTDYSKAFDRIDHETLIKKLNNMGIRGDLLRWFSSYIDNRSQAVVLNNYISSWVSVPSGVPQGSLLGPLLFVIYVNDIDLCLKSSNLLCFADDMKIFAKISSLEDGIALQADLFRLEEYCRVNKLDLNPLKCSVITYTRKRVVLTTTYTLSGQTLTRCDIIRDLGVHHDNKLTFEAHIDTIVKKAYKLLGFIMRLSKCFKNAKTLKILYCTFVRSQLEYASQIWNPRYSKYIDRIENIQKRFIKFLCFHQKIPYHSNDYVRLCKKYHLLPLVYRREIADCLFLLKIFNNNIDSPELLSKFYLNAPGKLLRFNPPLRVTHTYTNYRQNSYIVRVSKQFNMICKQHGFDLFSTSVISARRSLSLKFFE